MIEEVVDVVPICVADWFGIIGICLFFTILNIFFLWKFSREKKLLE